MAKWCDQGEANVLNIYLKNATQNANLFLGLYVAPTTEPPENAVLLDLTEPAGAGYARIQLPPDEWTVSGSTPTQALGLPKIFNCSGGNWGNVYGYFIATTSSGTAGLFVSVEQFTNGPYNVQDGGSVKVTPKVTCD